MKTLKPKNNVSPHSLEFAKTLPPMPSSFDCRFLYPTDDRDKFAFNSDTYPGRYKNTLIFLDERVPMAQLLRMIAYQQKVKATCFPFVWANEDGRVYPTVGARRGARIDHDKLQSWYDYCLAVIQHTGMFPIPGGHCCEDASDYARKDAAEIERVVAAVVTKLDPIVLLWCIGWEISKFWTPAECELVAQIYRKYTQKPIIVQNQGWHHALGKTIQGLAYEWKHHPKYGMEKSVAEIKAEYRSVWREMTSRGKGLIGSEWTIFTQTELAARQRKAITGWPATYGTWN